MAYLVTGGAGFIGSHLAETLLKQNHQVIVIDNMNDYYDVSIKQSNLERLSRYKNLVSIQGDIRDIDLIQRVFASYDIRRVAHMAAMAGVRASVYETPLYMSVNTMGTMNLLEVSRDASVDQFVLASTGSVYGNTTILPFTETDSADRPLASYPASKRAAEILAHAYYNLNGLNVTVLRFFNVYGEGGRPDMMPLRLMNAAFDSNQVISLFNGGDISRDWTYIQDTVDGVVKALHIPLGYEIINLGLGNPISLRNFVDIIEELTGNKITTVHVPTPPSDPPITYCNNQKARDLLGFNPQTSVEDGLTRMWYWYRDTMLK